MDFAYKNKIVLRYNAANDRNGNKVIKVFYADGTNEIIRGSEVYMFPQYLRDKFYRSMQGLRNSK